MNTRIPRPAAIAVLEHAGRFLLVRRANPPDPGRWGFPGGKIEWGETAAQAAVRELAEETGILAQALGAFDCVDVLKPDGPGSPGHHYVLVAVACRYVSGTAVAADDAAAARWVTLEEIEAKSMDFLDQVARLASRARALARDLV
ncbi:MAG: NUDIX hydrolase [Telmatospirillum sp.]|nr:NUDIX hydrolase [Telmatospirillum sp.]